MEAEMPEILLGVIIGGLIATVTPIVLIILDHRRWQRQASLEQLRFERKRLERMFRENVKKFSKAISENSYPSDMIMDFILIMPSEISLKFKEFLAKPNKTDAVCKKTIINVVSLMRKDLSDIDNEIERIISLKTKFVKMPFKK
jgi:hypothetical protein